MKENYEKKPSLKMVSVIMVSPVVNMKLFPTIDKPTIKSKLKVSISIVKTIQFNLLKESFENNCPISGDLGCN